MPRLTQLLLTTAVAATMAVVHVPPAAFAQNEPAGPAAPAKARALPEVFYTHDDAVRFALADAQSLASAVEQQAAEIEEKDPDEAKALREGLYEYRYLFIGHLHPDDWDDTVRLVDFAMNSISTRRTMVFAAAVPGSNNTLLRVKLGDYNQTADNWDTLGLKGSGPIPSIAKKDLPEPYFHTSVKTEKKVAASKKVTKKVQKTDDQGRKLFFADANGQLDESKPVMVDKEVDEPVYSTSEDTQIAHAPWLEQSPAVALAKILKTDFPVYRADWFVANALITPQYYRWFGWKNLKDVQKTARFREEDTDASISGVVSNSDEVAINQRATKYTATSRGVWWETFDFFTSIDEDNLLEDLRASRRDASEIIFSLTNLLQAYALVNGKGDLVDFADAAIAGDTRTSWRVKTVWAGVSCITCHDQGIKAVTDEVRLLSNDKVALLVKKKADFKVVVDLYSTPIEEPVLLGQQTYTRAVNLATRGWTPKQLALKMEKLFVAQMQGTLTLNDAALDCGYPPDAVVKSLQGVRGPNHTLSQLFLKRPVRRDQWAAKGFGQMVVLMKATSGK